MLLDLKRDEVGDYVRPNRLAIPDPKDPVLGARIDRIGKSGWGLYFYLWWTKGGTHLSVSVWLRTGTAAESAFSALRDMPSASRLELDAGHELSVSKTVQPEDAEQQMPVILRELIREFSALWTEAGGFEKFLKQ